VITAFLLVHCQPKRITAVAEELANTDGVAEVYTTTGSADCIAIVRVADLEALATVVTERIASFEGINRTDTHLAIRSWSASDEHAAFDIGID